MTYALVAAWHIDLPGVYMDEVNPDYLAVKILNPRHAPIVAWVLQANYLLGDRVPMMVQLYHGSQTFWLGLPLFWLFGTTVEGLPSRRRRRRAALQRDPAARRRRSRTSAQPDTT